MGPSANSGLSLWRRLVAGWGRQSYFGRMLMELAAINVTAGLVLWPCHVSVAVTFTCQGQGYTVTTECVPR